MASSTPKSRNPSNSATVGFEATLWQAADKLRSNMDAAEYKHVLLGLIFLKHISDSFEERRALHASNSGEFEGANPEDRDEYLSARRFNCRQSAITLSAESRAEKFKDSP